MLALINSIGLPAIAAPGPPVSLDAGAIVLLDATAIYDAREMQLLGDYVPLRSLTQVLAEGGCTSWIDAKDFS